jgi:hypothetical protein
MKFVGAEFFSGATFYIFACSARTRRSMDKWMARLDSAHQKGLETTSHEVFNCSGDASTGGEVCWGKILKIGNSRRFCLRSRNQ